MKGLKKLVKRRLSISDAGHATAQPEFPPNNHVLQVSRARRTVGCLSHFQPGPILSDGAVCPTAEHSHRAQKSGEPDVWTVILTARHAVPYWARTGRVHAYGHPADAFRPGNP